MHKALATLATITIVWFAGSTYWYVCNVQYLCQKTQSPAAITAQAVRTGESIVQQAGVGMQTATQNAQIENVTIPAPSDVRFVDESIVIDPDKRTTLNFLPDSTEFTGEQDVENIVAATVVYLRANPDTRIRVDGYTADVGPNYGDCEWMSQVRAQTVKDLLVQAGIETGRIDTVANAAANPVADNSTPQGMAMNRRATITILN